ncbi:fibronectin type III and SPRY domain-containing protein 2 [Rhinophrynus dorsalis]
MEAETLEELEVNSPTDTTQDKAEGQEEFVKEDNEQEQEGLIIYHPDLYDSPEALVSSPEDLKYEHIGKEDELGAAEEKTAPCQEKIHSDPQKDVDVLEKQHSALEDKETEDYTLLTNPPFKHSENITLPTIPNRKKKLQFNKQNKVNEVINKEAEDVNKEMSMKKEYLSDQDKELECEDRTLKHNGGECEEESGQPSEERGQSKEQDGQWKQEVVSSEHGDGSLKHEGEHPDSEGHAADLQKQLSSDADKAGIESKQLDSDYQISNENEASDIFCITCKAPGRAFEKLFGVHKDHDVTHIDTAVKNHKEEIQKNMSKLEEQIVQMENFASHLEEIYITVEENFARQEQSFETQYTEIMDALTSRHEEKVQSLAEEKKLKLESLFEQLIDCGKSLDTSKDLMETIQELFKGKDKVEFVKTALNTTNRLNEYFNTDINLNISTNAEYENTNTDFSEVEQLLDSIHTVPAPSAPVINPQAPNSATATSLRVCWSLFSDDTVESYQLYYKPVCDGAPGEDQEEFVIRAKETYCTVTNLSPNTQYEFWVTALNITGGSPASESAVYVTAPSPPIIKCSECRSCENAALICWESGNMNPVDSYTVEIYKVTNEANEDFLTESIVGIPICESLIQLQPNEMYHISVRAVNVGGPSETSTSVSIHTTGTFFHLDKETAHPLLSICDDGFTITCDEEESLVDLPYDCKNFSRCIAVLGNLIPFKGKHYWEIEVKEDTEYRVGVAYEDTNRNGLLGANNTSWCLRHILTPSRHKYEFLHCGIAPDIRITIPPTRIGILLDYDSNKLSFFNMDFHQHLFTFDCHFRHLVHPCFGLERPGSLKIHNSIPIPHFVILP